MVRFVVAMCAIASAVTLGACANSEVARSDASAAIDAAELDAHIDAAELDAHIDAAELDAHVDAAELDAHIDASTGHDACVPGLELCNGVDDNCNVMIDEAFPTLGQICTVGMGACARTGANVCNGDGDGVTCDASPDSPTAEVCGDGIDQDCDGADVACPINDGPDGAVAITGGGTFAVDLSAAHNDQDFTGPSCGSTGGRDVFYTFTLPVAEVVYFDTFGSNFDTSVRVFAGSCTALGALQRCFDDQCNMQQSQGALSLAAGTYCMVVDQYSSAQTSGALTFTFTRSGRTGAALASTSGSVTGTTVGATNVWTPSCSSGSTAGDQGHYFLACPGQVPTVTASTCATPTSWDSVLYLRKSGSDADLVCNDDGGSPCGTASPIRLSAFAGATGSGAGLYWIVVDGFLSTTGAYTLSYTVN